MSSYEVVSAGGVFGGVSLEVSDGAAEGIAEVFFDEAAQVVRIQNPFSRLVRVVHWSVFASYPGGLAAFIVEVLNDKL